MLPDIKRGLDEYASRLARMHKVDQDKFQPWIDNIVHQVELHISKIPDTDWLVKGGLTKQAMCELRKVQQHMAIGVCDKSSHDMMAICKIAYLHALKKELHSGVYQQTALTDSQIWDNHAQLAAQLGRTTIRAHSYLYGAVKMH